MREQHVVLGATGRRGRWLGRLDQPHSLSFTPDVARHLAVLGHDDRSFGHAWHLPVDRAVTGAEVVAMAHRIAGIDCAPGLITPWMYRLAGLVKRDAREGIELMDEFTRPFVLDDSRFRAAFGTQTDPALAPAPTPLERALAASIRRRRPPA